MLSNILNNITEKENELRKLLLELGKQVDSLMELPENKNKLEKLFGKNKDLFLKDKHRVLEDTSKIINIDRPVTLAYYEKNFFMPNKDSIIILNEDGTSLKECNHFHFKDNNENDYEAPLIIFIDGKICVIEHDYDFRRDTVLILNNITKIYENSKNYIFNI